MGVGEHLPLNTVPSLLNTIPPSSSKPFTVVALLSQVFAFLNICLAPFSLLKCKKNSEFKLCKWTAPVLITKVGQIKSVPYILF